MTRNEALAAIRSLVSEAAEYAGPEDEDESNNVRLWANINEAELAVSVLEGDFEALAVQLDRAVEDKLEAEADLEREQEIGANNDALLAAVRDLLDGYPGAHEAIRLAVDKVDPDYRQPIISPWTGRVTP